MDKVSHGLTLGILSVAQPQYVFLAENGRILIEKEIKRTRLTGNRIIPSIKSCLDEINSSIKSIDTFMALSGPGSMTGIRAGLAPIRAWGYVSNKNVLLLPTLSVLAYGFEKPVLALMAAGKDKWWGQAFSGDMKDTPRIMDEEKLKDYDNCDWTWISPAKVEPKQASVIKHFPIPKQVISIMDDYESTSWMRALPQYLFEITND